MMNAGINASLAILLSFFISFMEELSEMKLTKSRTIILISGLILMYLLSTTVTYLYCPSKSIEYMQFKK